MVPWLFGWVGGLSEQEVFWCADNEETGRVFVYFLIKCWWTNEGVALRGSEGKLWREIGVYQPFSLVSFGKNAYDMAGLCKPASPPPPPGAPPPLTPLDNFECLKLMSALFGRWGEGRPHGFLNKRSKCMRDKANFHTLNNLFLLFYCAWPNSSKFNFWTPLKRYLGNWWWGGGVGEGFCWEEHSYFWGSKILPAIRVEEHQKNKGSIAYSYE